MFVERGQTLNMAIFQMEWIEGNTTLKERVKINLIPVTVSQYSEFY
jgi:hypothetical protein